LFNGRWPVEPLVFFGYIAELATIILSNRHPVINLKQPPTAINQYLAIQNLP